MPRNVTLFTGQWADLSLPDLAAKASQMGYDGLELACWGDHFDVDKAAVSKKYCQERWEILSNTIGKRSSPFLWCWRPQTSSRGIPLGMPSRRRSRRRLSEFGLSWLRSSGFGNRCRGARSRSQSSSCASCRLVTCRPAARCSSGRSIDKRYGSFFHQPRLRL